MLQLTTPIMVTYGTLTLALAGLWIPRSKRFPVLATWCWLLPLSVAILLGLYFGFLQPVSLLPITLFGFACFYWFRPAENSLLKMMSGGVVLIMTIALFLHVLPGFYNPKIISGLKLSTDAFPYDKYLNFDSALIGLGILGFGHRQLTGSKEWGAMLIRSIPVVLATLMLVMLLSLWLGYVHWQPKWTSLFIVWVLRKRLFSGVSSRKT